MGAAAAIIIGALIEDPVRHSYIIIKKGGTAARANSTPLSSVYIIESYVFFFSFIHHPRFHLTHFKKETTG